MTRSMHPWNLEDPLLLNTFAICHLYISIIVETGAEQLITGYNWLVLNKPVFDMD